MDVEEEILEYLFEYGNTKETDLIRYLQEECRVSDRHIKKVIAKMKKDGKVHRVIHNKLKPPAVYLSLHEHIPLEIAKELIRASAEFRKAELEAISKGERR
jgi:predicted transcriptional regulator